MQYNGLNISVYLLYEWVTHFVVPNSKCILRMSYTFRCLKQQIYYTSELHISLSQTANNRKQWVIWKGPTKRSYHILVFGATSHQCASASSFTRFIDHAQRRTTACRTPLDEWSALRTDFYLTTHNTHNRGTSMPPVGFEPTISADARPQTYALDCSVTGIGYHAFPMSTFRTLQLINENKNTRARASTHTHTHTHTQKLYIWGIAFRFPESLRGFCLLKSQNHVLISNKSFFHDCKSAGTWIWPFTISAGAITLCFIRPHGEHRDCFIFKKTHVNEHRVIDYYACQQG